MKKLYTKGDAKAELAPLEREAMAADDARLKALGRLYMKANELGHPELAAEMAVDARRIERVVEYVEKPCATCAIALAQKKAIAAEMAVDARRIERSCLCAGAYICIACALKARSAGPR